MKATFETQIEEINEKINNLKTNLKDTMYNHLQLSKELIKAKKVIENQEKRIIWCEENIKANISPK